MKTKSIEKDCPAIVIPPDFNVKTDLNLEILHNYRDRGLIYAKAHPSLPLWIWNYTDKCMFKKLWDPVTMLCRSLVTNADGNPVFYSFPKFFNEFEHPTATNSTGFEVYEKLDGSLGLMFFHDNTWHICSRGSFDSVQAARALQIATEKYDVCQLDASLSYAVEIIYPENRIVVEYPPDRVELKLLATYGRDGVEQYPMDAEKIARAGMSIVQSYDKTALLGPEHHALDTATALERLAGVNWDNHEGFVIRYGDGQRTKIKFEKYRNQNENGTVTLESKLADFPKHVHQEYILLQWSAIQTAYDAFHEPIRVVYETEYTMIEDQGDFARAIKHSGHPHLDVLHLMRKNSPTLKAHIISRYVSKRVREVPFNKTLFFSVDSCFGGNTVWEAHVKKVSDGTDV
eukprot:gene24665-31034_t